MSKHVWSALIAVCMALALMTTGVLAEEPEALTEEAEALGEETLAEEAEAPAEEPEDLEAEEVFYGSSDEEEDIGDGLLLQAFYGDSGIAPLGEIGTTPSYNELNYYQRDLYARLRTWIEDINTREVSASTVYSFRMSTGAQATAMMNDALKDSNFGPVSDCLIHDLPGDFYWYNRAWAWRVSGTEVTISLRVAKDYRVYEDDLYTLSGIQIRRAHRSVANAREILEQAQSCSDYDKLAYYRDQICALTEYNYDALDMLNEEFLTGVHVEIQDPWALVYVFDGDPSTNVVCEGYSKAFQYLCDNTSWSDSSIQCFTVSGYMDGGAHMWNIVQIAGKNYLVDVTNCDRGSIGYPDKLFLAGGTGSVSSGYRVLNILYVYYGSDRNPASDKILALSSTNYVPTPTKVLRGTVVISGTPEAGNTIRADVSNLMASNAERPTGLTYEWRVGGTVRARTAQYTVQADDIGKTITVTVSAANYTTSVTSAPVTAADDGKLHGKVSISAADVCFPTEDGALVTANQRLALHVTPDSGYRLSSIEVVDANGRKITLSGSGNDYTFQMPSADVTVRVKFTRS